MPCKKTMDMGGAPPHTDNLIRSAAGGRRPNRTVEKTTREWRALSSLPSCNSLALLNSARSNARKADLEAGPPDSLSTKPTIGGGLRPCQSRNGATKSTIAEESFPDDVTQPSQVSTREQPKEPSWTRDTRNKELNSRGKTNQLRACFKPIQASTNWIPNPDWTG